MGRSKNGSTLANLKGENMINSKVDEESLKYTLIDYLESENQFELAKIVEHTEISYDPQYEFSYVISNQKKMHIILRVPTNLRSRIIENLSVIRKCIFDIYIDDANYMLTDVKVGIKAIQLENFEVKERPIIVEKNSIYSSLIKRLLSDNELSELHKNYLYEACNVGSLGNMMAATMMLGCAAEISLLELVNATYEYFKSSKSDTEITNFEKKVLNVKSAYTRLDELYKRLKIEKELLNSCGIENIDTFFGIFEVIRISRNDVGHPTGKVLNKEAFEVQLTAYMSIINQYQTLLRNLIRN